jgi:hypothetical protein
MGCNCGGQSKGQRLEYQVKLNSGKTKTVGSLAEAKLALATGGGGSYKAVPKQ